MPKPSQLPLDSSPVTTDYVVGNQASGPTTQRFKFSDLISLFWTLANIPAGQTSPITRDSEMQFPFVASGMVWSGDSYGVNRNASMTAGICYINGRRISISAVTARTFTASVDTYVDVLDNGDGTGTLVYTTALNNAASPALAANSMRIGIIVTGATTIAAAGSVNQGQETMVLPIASTIAYSVTDSLGNLICPRDPNHRLLGYRQITGNIAKSNANAAIAGLSAPVIIPTGRKIIITTAFYLTSTDASAGLTLAIYDTSTAGTLIQQSSQYALTTGAGYGVPPAIGTLTPASTSKTYITAASASAGNQTWFASATSPAYIRIELE